MEKLDAAYIAGFFDGDGSVRIQFQPRKKARHGFRIRAEISLAQKVGSERHLQWIKKKLGIGYIYTRNDGISELKIEGFNRVKSILQSLVPFIHFKKKQVKLVLKALEIINKNTHKISQKDFIIVSQISDQISNKNYATAKKKYTAEFIKKTLKEYPRND